MDAHFHRTEGWPIDAQRHSYASYRVAITRNIPAVAMEMGNSEAIIKSNYLEAADLAVALEYFRTLEEHPAKILKD